MGAGGVEIAILKLGHSSSNRVLPPLVEMSWQRSLHSKLKEKTYKSAAPPLTTCIFLNWQPLWYQILNKNRTALQKWKDC